MTAMNLLLVAERVKCGQVDDVAGLAGQPGLLSARSAWSTEAGLSG
jgi:hypothetical protein